MRERITHICIYHTRSKRDFAVCATNGQQWNIGKLCVAKRDLIRRCAAGGYSGCVKSGKRNKIEIFQFEKYVLGNVSFAAQIRNQNTYNIEDAEYDVNNDCGHFSPAIIIIIRQQEDKTRLLKTWSIRLRGGLLIRESIL